MISPPFPPPARRPTAAASALRERSRRASQLHLGGHQGDELLDFSSESLDFKGFPSISRAFPSVSKHIQCRNACAKTFSLHIVQVHKLRCRSQKASPHSHVADKCQSSPNEAILPDLFLKPQIVDPLSLHLCIISSPLTYRIVSSSMHTYTYILLHIYIY